jgi:hypothetical protein
MQQVLQAAKGEANGVVDWTNFPFSSSAIEVFYVNHKFFSLLALAAKTKH